MMFKDLHILILGSGGQLARSFADLKLSNATFVDRSELDLAYPDRVAKQLDSIFARQRFKIIINTAAYTQVDNAEQEIDLAEKVNSTSVGEVARWCASHDIFLVHFSTDYVFSGQGEAEWTEADVTAPVNVYGRTKRSGELSAIQTGVKGLIIRTSWLYSPYGKNFVRTMLSLRQDPLRVVSDQFGSPTFARHLVEATLALIQATLGQFPTIEVFHVTNSGFTSWNIFASEIFRLAQVKGLIKHPPQVVAITHDQFKARAQRPLNSRLSKMKLLIKAKIEMPPWQAGIEECMEIIRGMPSES